MKALSILVLFTASFACSHPAFSPDDEKEIRGVIARQEAGWNAGSIEAYMEGYERSDSVRFISGGTVTYGWQTVLDRYKKGYTDRASMGTLAFSDLRVQGMGPERAIVYGKWELTRENDHPWGMFTLIFKKTKSGWRIVHDHTSAAR